jgi:hypothetical protein
MDIAEFFRTSTSSRLLVLMAFPLISAVLLIIFLAYFSIKRSKKSQMKHGISRKDEPDALESKGETQPVTPHEITEKDPSAFDKTITSSPNSPLDLNLALLQNTTKENNLMTKQQPPPAKSDLATSGSMPPSSTPPSVEPVELLRLLRDPHSNQLMIEIGGQRYTKLSDVDDKKIGQFILKLAAHLLAFTNGMIVTEAGVKSVYNPKVGPLPEPVVSSRPSPELSPTRPPSPAEEPFIPKPPPEAEAAFLATLHTQSTLQPDPLPPVVPSGGGLFGRRPPAPAPMSLPSLNLAGEINKIVQTRLMYSPLGTNTKVDILSAPDGGIRINVNGKIYNSPDEVADPDIKQLIKESIKQWERI